MPHDVEKRFAHIRLVLLRRCKNLYLISLFYVVSALFQALVVYLAKRKLDYHKLVFVRKIAVSVIAEYYYVVAVF